MVIYPLITTGTHMHSILEDMRAFEAIPDSEYKLRVEDINLDVWAELPDSTITAILHGILSYDEVDALARQTGLVETRHKPLTGVLILELLHSAPQPLPSGIIADVIGRSRPNVSTALSRLKRSGHVQCTPNGYQIVQISA